MDKRTLDVHKESKTISTLKTELHRLEQVLAQQAKEFSAEREATEKRVYELQQKISVSLLENTELKTENTTLHASLRKLNAGSSQEERSEKWCVTCHALEQRLAADTTDKHTADAVKLATQELERKLKREQKQMEKTLQEKFEDRESELVGENKRLLKQLTRANAAKEQNENRAAIAISKSNDTLIARLQTEASEHQQQAAKHEELITSLKQQLQALQSEHASSSKRVKDAEQRVAEFRLRQTSLEKAKVVAETECAQQLSELKSVHKAEKAKFEEQEKAKTDASVLKAQRAEAARKASEERVKEVQRQVTTLTEQLAADKQSHVSEVATLKSQLKAENKKLTSLLEQAQQEQQKAKEAYTKKLVDQQKIHEQESIEFKKQLKEVGKTFEAQQLQQTDEAQACKQLLEEALTQARHAHSQLEHQHQALNEQYKGLEIIRVGLETTLGEQTAKLNTIQKEYEDVTEKTRMEHQSLVSNLTHEHQRQLESNKSEYEDELRAVESQSVDRVKELNETYVAALQRFTLQHEEKVAAIEAAHTQTLAGHMQQFQVLTKERDDVLTKHQHQLESNKSDYEDKLRAVEMQSVDRVKELNETYVAALQRFTLQHEEKVAAIEAAHAQTLVQQATVLTKERDDTLKQISTEQQSANEQFLQLQSDLMSVKAELVYERETITQLRAAQKLELDNIIRVHEVKFAEAQASHNEAMVVLQELNKEQSDADLAEFTQKLSVLEMSLAEKEAKFVALQHEQITTTQAIYQRELEALQSLHAEQLSSAKKNAATVAEKAEENARQYEARITQLTCAVSELTHSQVVNTEEIATYKSTIAMLEATRNEITVKFETLDCAFSEFKDQATVEMKNQLDKFALAQTEMSQQNEDLKAQYEAASKAHASTQAMLGILQQKFDEAKQEYVKELQQKTQEDATTYKNEMEQIRQKYDNEIKQYSLQIETLQSEFNGQTKALESFEHKYEEEKKQQVNKLETLQITLHDQIEKLQQEKLKCEDELKSMEKRYIDETQKHVDKYEILRQQYGQQNNQVEMLQQKIDVDIKKFDQEKQMLIAQLASNRREFDEKAEMFKNEKDINEENTRQQDLQFENLQRIYHATAQQLQTLQTEHEVLKARANDNKSHFEQLQQTQKQEFEIQLKQTVEEEMNKHMQSMKEARKEFDFTSEQARTQHDFALQTIQKELEQKIVQVHSESEVLMQAARKDFELEMESMKEMNKKEVQILNEHVMKLQQEREGLVLSHSHTVSEMHAALEAYKIQLEESKIRCVALEEASCKLETALKATQTSASTLAAETQAGYEAKLAALSCRLAAVNAKHLACDGVIADLKEQIANERESAHSKQIRTAEDLLAHHSSELKTVRAEMEGQISALMESQHGLEERLQQTQEQHGEELIQNREDFNDTLSNLKERHQQQIEATTRTHKQQLSQLQEKLSTLQQAYDLTNTQLVEAQNEVKELSERIAKVPEQTSKPESDSVQKKAVKEYEAEMAKLKKQHSVELMKVSHKVKMEANKDSEIERKQAIEVAEAALEDRLRHEFSRETEKLKKELAKQNEMHSKKLESALSVRRPFQEMNTGSLANAQEDVHLERMVQEANQQNKAIQLKRTENPGTFLLGVRRLHLSVIGGVLSVRIGGGFITFPEFVKKYGKDEGQRIFDNAVDENAEWASVSTKYGLDENKPAEQEDDKPKKARKSLALDSKTASAVKERATKFRRHSVAPS